MCSRNCIIIVIIIINSFLLSEEMLYILYIIITVFNVVVVMFQNCQVIVTSLGGMLNQRGVLVLMLMRTGILFGEVGVVAVGVMMVVAVGVMFFAYCFS